jgi:uncharacterized protein with HEPN domain
MNKSDTLYIEQMQDALEKIRSFTVGMSEDEFDGDQKTQSAVIMQLLILGELTKKLSDETKEKVDLPWRHIAGFRDYAAHDYFDVDLSIVWTTVQNNIPEMQEKLDMFASGS